MNKMIAFYMLMTQKYIVIRNQSDQQKLQTILNMIKKLA